MTGPTTELVSASTFKWILTVLTALGSLWALYDIIHILRLVNSRADRSDPAVRDKYFGYAIGIAVGLLGFAGILRYHDVL